MMSAARRLTFLVLAGLAVGLAAPGVDATPSDGTVVGATKLVDHGSDSERFDIVLVAEGYGEAEQGLFETHAQAFADYFLDTPPFRNNCSAFNVWRIDVVSAQSGADDPADCEGGSDTAADTYFDATFCADGVHRRLLAVDAAGVIGVLDANVPGWDQALVIVNSDEYGGSAGGVAVASVSGPWQRVALHHIGHSAFGLADEYEYWLGCDEDLDQDIHPAVEPVEPNVSIVTDLDFLAWADLILPETPLPTTENADCSVCDPQSDPSPGETVVGLYEGAHYFHCDAYRPAFDCMMRNFGDFCPVCERRILETLEPFQPANSPPVCDANGPYVAECAGEITNATLNGTASSDPDCDVLSYAWSGEFVESTAEGPMPEVGFSGLGSFGVELEISDGAESATCAADVTVEDTTPPMLTVEDVTAECESPEGTAVDLGTPEVTEVCDPSVDPVNDAPELFALGVTDVTWTGTDDSGNVGEAVQVVTVVDTTPPVIVAPEDVVIECASPDGTPAELGEPAVEDICDPAVAVSNDAPALFPLGETVVTWTAMDASGNVSTATQTVTVIDTTPPGLSLSLDPERLWPPNHKLKTITAWIEVTDICDANPSVRLDSVVSNEPDNGIGDGDTANDIQNAQFGTDDREFWLRAERAGNGDGRIYTATYTAEDASGNTTTRQDEVRVPHDMGQSDRP